MSTQVSGRSTSRVGSLLRSALLAPFRLRTYASVAFVAALFPLGLAYFISLTVTLSLGLGLSVIGIGIAVLGAALAGTRVVAWFERRLHGALLGTEFHQPSLGVPDEPDVLGKLKAFYLDAGLALELVYLLTKLAWGIAAFTLLVWFGATTVSFLAVPFYYDLPGAAVGLAVGESVKLAGSLRIPYDDIVVGAKTVVELTGWSVDTFPEAMLFAAFGVVFLVAGLNLLVLFARLEARWAGFFLDRPPEGDGDDG